MRYKKLSALLSRLLQPSSSSVLLLCLLSLCFPGCSGVTRKRTQASSPLQIASAVILRADQPDQDPNLRAYGEAFSAVSLGWRLEPLSKLETLPLADSPLVLVVPARTARALSPAQTRRVVDLVEAGAVLVSEEITPLSESFGFSKRAPVQVREIQEVAYPDVIMLWQRAQMVSPLAVPAAGRVLMRERKSGATLSSLLPRGRGKIVLLAAEFDREKGEGYLRFPYFIQALVSAGVRLPFRGERLEALFDYGYREKDDVEELAKRWRQSGIRALQVGAWSFYDSNPKTDQYLATLISACHRNGILVYAWLELPHVSELFWDQHPQWREKTGTDQDAHVDWRYLMNLKNEQCFHAVSTGIRRMLSAFDWDGVNLSELYFESPAGPKEPDQFTPLNAEVRSEFKQRHGFDPLDYFNKNSPHYWKTHSDEWAKFVDYRVEQERALYERFLEDLSEFRVAAKPDLGMIMLYVDNIYDPSMREGVGADFHAILPLLDRFDLTLVMEDPWTTWHLGPRRYQELAHSYALLTPHVERLGIDINIVDRPQEVYPARQQTGLEFLQLFHHAAANFRTVMVYSEQTMWSQDLELVGHAMASGVSVEPAEGGVRISSSGTVVFCSGLGEVDVAVDGVRWPCRSGGDILLPVGAHIVSAATERAMPRPRLVRLNGELVRARYVGDQEIEISYRARPRAIALFDRAPKSIQLDGVRLAGSPADWVMLPGGAHVVHAAF